MSNKIDNDVKEILEQSTITESSLVLPDIQLSRELYVKVNNHLTYCGGKWNRKEKAHIFKEGTERIKEGIEKGETISEQKEYHAFYTPSHIAKDLVFLADLKKGDLVLEPNGGGGALVNEILKYTDNIDIVEINDRAFKNLTNNYSNYKNINVTQGDFLKYKNNKKYKAVLMNPPFNNNEWIKHVKHALSFSDTVYAITPTNYNKSYFKKHIEEADIFYSILDEYENAFEGTNIKVYLTRFDK